MAKRILTVLIIAALAFSGCVGLAAEWKEGLSASQPYSGVPEVDLNSIMGYYIKVPSQKLPTTKYCDTLMIYLPREDIRLASGKLHLYEGTSTSSTEIASVDFADIASVSVRALTEDELTMLMWGSGVSIDVKLPRSLEFRKNYYVLLDAGAFTASNGKVSNPAIEDATEWQPVLEGDYGVSGLGYYTAPVVTSDPIPAAAAPADDAAPADETADEADAADEEAPEEEADEEADEAGEGIAFIPFSLFGTALAEEGTVSGAAEGADISGGGINGMGAGGFTGGDLSVGGTIVGDPFGSFEVEDSDDSDTPELGVEAPDTTIMPAPAATDAPYIDPRTEYEPEVSDYKTKPAAGDTIRFDLVLGGEAVAAAIYSENNSVSFAQNEYTQSGTVKGIVSSTDLNWGILFIDARGEIIDWVKIA